MSTSEDRPQITVVRKDNTVVVGGVEVDVTVGPPPNEVTVASPGPQGPPGAPGAVGPPGGALFTFTQSVPSITWTINHGLGRHPNVVITEIDGVDLRYLADYTDISLNSLTIGFNAPHTGKAELE